jgi:plastocyanin
MAPRGWRTTILALTLCALAASHASAQVTVDVIMPPGQTLFYPRVVVINVNDTVRWTNQTGTGQMSHSATSDDGSTFDSGLLAPGATFSKTFGAAGVFPYRCTVSNHAALGMRGVVIVGSRTSRAANETALTIGAWDFVNLQGTAIATGNAPQSRIFSGTITGMVRMPSGTQISGIELSACDSPAAGTFTATLFECVDPGGACNTITSVPTSGDGCQFFSSPATSWTVDNLGYTYVLEVASDDVDPNLSLRNVRIFHKKQISPPPGTPSFNDVPANHAFYQMIEALKASGITAGCGGSNYCPDASLTRGQMAVFLARGLGIMWPN